MEENLIRVFSVLISVIIFFLLPIYITFEKKDDISYALALKITTEFVENVRNNGYVSKEMYENYVSRLSVTDNVYDIFLEHKEKKYIPVIYSYSSDGKNILKDFDYNMYIKKIVPNPSDTRTTFKSGEIPGKIVIDAVDYGNLVYSFKSFDNVYSEKQIIARLYEEKLKIGNDLVGDLNQKDGINSEDLSILNGSLLGIVTLTDLQKKLADLDSNGTIGYNDLQLLKQKLLNTINGFEYTYTMNKGDEFNVRLINKNTSIATVLFNTLTLGAMSGNNTRVYINYGGTILKEAYKL